MKQKRYWLRGIVISILLYVLVVAISVSLFLSGSITCNEFVTDGPAVTQSILCTPAITIVALPLFVISEFTEDITTGSISHIGVYLGSGASVLAYVAIFAFLGFLYGERKRRITSR